LPLIFFLQQKHLNFEQNNTIMVRARVTFFLLFILIYSASNALTIKGTFLNTSGEGLQSITVLLRQLPDSSIRKMTATNQEGNFELTEILPGAYFLQATSPAYSTHYSDIVELKDDYDFSKITLKESSKKLKEVDIVAQKPLIENKPGKIVVNVEALISAAGKTAFDILEQSPNITIDRNSNIRMRGKQGVIVMIDGKRTPMSGEDLANFLRSLPANAVEKIEIITNPSSKYDAAGNAGIINIIMKKDKRLGTNGTVTLSGGHGRYYKMNNGISVNNRNKKLNVFGSYNLSYRKGFNDLALYRKFYAADT
jgi:iron complex outermembrane receptor protein